MLRLFVSCLLLQDISNRLEEYSADKIKVIEENCNLRWLPGNPCRFLAFRGAREISLFLIPSYFVSTGRSLRGSWISLRSKRSRQGDARVLR